MNNHGYQQWQDPYAYANNQAQSYGQDGRPSTGTMPNNNDMMNMYQHNQRQYQLNQNQQQHQSYQNNLGQDGYAQNRQQYTQTQHQQVQHAYSPMYTSPGQYHAPQQQQQFPIHQAHGFQPQMQYQQYPQYQQDQSGYLQQSYMITPPTQHIQLPSPAPIPASQGQSSHQSIPNSTISRSTAQHVGLQRQQSEASPKIQAPPQPVTSQQHVQNRRSSQQTGQAPSPMMQSQGRLPHQNHQQQRASTQPSPSLISKPSPVHQLQQASIQSSPRRISQSFPQSKAQQYPAQPVSTSSFQSTPQSHTQGHASSFPSTISQQSSSHMTPTVKQEQKPSTMVGPGSQTKQAQPRPAPSVQMTPPTTMTINPADLFQAAPVTEFKPRTSSVIKAEHASNGTPNNIPSPAARPNESPINLQVLMLSLAEEYISEARSISKGIALNSSTDEAVRYYRLIAQGLGCLNSIITRWRISDPRTEARLRLRYASLLYEETENDTQAQEVLNKGIALCERNRLVDLKNTMNHLLARIQFKSSPRAALKMIENLLPDLEIYKQTVWVYAFRFLRVSLFLRQPSSQDIQNALQQLKAVTQQAESRRHVSICMMSSALEALIHLRTGTAEVIDQAQRALSKARSHQLDPSLAQAPQVTALVNILDLLVDLLAQKTESATPKLQTVQNLMDKASKDPHWRDDGAFFVPLPLQAPDTLDQDADGIMKRTTDGHYALVFDWLTRSELYSLGYILSGVATLQKDTTDRRAFKFFTEGIKITQDSFEAQERAGQSLENVSAHLDKRISTRYTMQLYLVCAFCVTSEWSTARQSLDELARTAANGTARIEHQLLTYLEGVTHQGSGHDHAALQSFRAPELALPTQPPKHGGADLDLRILAAMNTCLLLQGSRSTQAEAQALLKRLSPYAVTHQNRTIVSAVNLLRANIDSTLPIVQMKNHITAALNAARDSSNQQLLTVIMNMMVVRFFTNTVGDQAEKSAEVGVKLAKKVHSPLWQAVANQNLGTTMDLGGRMDRAVSAKTEAQEIWEQVPDAIRQKFEGSG